MHEGKPLPIESPENTVSKEDAAEDEELTGEPATSLNRAPVPASNWTDPSSGGATMVPRLCTAGRISPGRRWTISAGSGHLARRSDLFVLRGHRPRYDEPEGASDDPRRPLGSRGEKMQGLVSLPLIHR